MRFFSSMLQKCIQGDQISRKISIVCAQVLSNIIIDDDFDGRYSQFVKYAKYT